jgi:hypothetical protein
MHAILSIDTSHQLASAAVWVRITHIAECSHEIVVNFNSLLLSPPIDLISAIGLPKTSNFEEFSRTR